MQTVPGNNTAAVKNCTLEDIDVVCLDLQRLEFSFVNTDIQKYVKDSPALLPFYDAPEVWLNCTLSHSQEALPCDAVSYILDKIRF